MKVTDTELESFFTKTRKTIARLRKSEVLEDKIFYDALVKHYLEKTKEKK